MTFARQPFSHADYHGDSKGRGRLMVASVSLEAGLEISRGLRLAGPGFISSNSHFWGWENLKICSVSANSEKRMAMLLLQWIQSLALKLWLHSLTCTSWWTHAWSGASSWEDFRRGIGTWCPTTKKWTTPVCRAAQIKSWNEKFWLEILTRCTFCEWPPAKGPLVTCPAIL